MDVPDDWHEFGRNPVDDWIGLRWVEIGADRVVATADLGAAHQQPYGLTHGGVWCAIVESVASFGAGTAVHEQGMHVVGVNNTTDFIRSHREGPVTATGTAVHVGRRQQLWEVVITRDADGKTVARGTVRLQNLPSDRDR